MATRQHKISHGRQGIVHGINLIFKESDISLDELWDLYFDVAWFGSQRRSDGKEAILNFQQLLFPDSVHMLVTQYTNPCVQFINRTVTFNAQRRFRNALTPK